MTAPATPPPPTASIREFLPGDAPAFRALNEEWITRFFALEPKDLYSLTHPETTILDPGGRIFFALAGDVPVGCCALLFMAPGEYEVAKMAVTPSARGHRPWPAPSSPTPSKPPRAASAARLYLETNHALTPAIRLYESLGFRHIPPARITPSPYARADVYMELLLAPGTSPLPQPPPR